MFKVMIVDDEIYVVSLIQNLIDWNKYDMEVIGTADNGLTALSDLESLQPDIVIVDVRMPGYDGITFMQKVREINTRTKFIVISGHKRFEYAKSAMQYNVEDYLIKPINKEELEQILEKLRQKLNDEIHIEKSQQTMREELTVKQRKIHDYFLDSFLQKRISSAQLSEDFINRTYFLNFQSGQYTGLVFKIDSKHAIPDSTFTKTLLQRLEALLIESFQPVCEEVAFHLTEDSVYALCNYRVDALLPLQLQIKSIFHKFTDILQKFEDLVLTIGVGAPENSLRDINSSIQSARDCICARVSLGVQRIIFSSELRTDPGVIQIVLSDNVKTNWKEAIHNLQFPQIKMQLLNIMTHAEDYKYQDNLIFDKSLTSISHDFFNYIVSIDQYKDSYETFWNDIQSSIRWCFTSRMLVDAASEQMKLYISAYISNDSSETNPAVRIAKKHIAENYRKNISMVATAELVNLSPVYFSVLFKREVGTNFLDYLNQFRLEIAKGLLKQIRYNVNEVAELSGFSDTKYFSKLFKKTFGITPTEYRKRNAN